MNMKDIFNCVNEISMEKTSLEIDLSPLNDGGVLKRVNREGAKELGHPLIGDRVSVHYVGTLTDGTKFDSSRDRGKHFTFTLGKGEVIQAWDLGVASMLKGEICVLTCRPSYGYGEEGSLPTIPPAATLTFEVELLDWKGEDLSDNQDDGIIRSIIERGQDDNSPTDGATCHVSLCGQYDGRVFDSRELTFILGEGEEHSIVSGIESALKMFTEGEKSRLQIACRYGFGEKGSDEFGVPAGKDIQYDVTLNTFHKCKEVWEMHEEEKLNEAKIAKEKGTDFFKCGKFSLAIHYYKKVVRYVGDDTSNEDQEERRALRIAAHLNMALSHLKLSQYIEARQHCDLALQLDPKNEKGYYRRGLAQMNLENYAEALDDMNDVLRLDVNNKAAINQITITTVKLQQQKDKQRQLYAGMFQKFAETDYKKEAEEKARVANLVMDDWSNSMADGMMTIQQEAEAFGETLADLQYDSDEGKENIDPRR